MLAHGSRNGETEASFEQIVAYARGKLDVEYIETAYMEFRGVNLEKGMLNLVNKGVTDIRIVPYFLFDGMHIREYIPGKIREFQKDHPGIDVTLGKTLGVDKRLADVLADRIRETLRKNDCPSCGE